MFWVISTALVLQGVIMAARGTTKKSTMADCTILGWLPKSQVSFEWFPWKARLGLDQKQLVFGVPKKWIMGGFLKAQI